MKLSNNTALKNNMTQPETIQEPKHLFREVEKRYNIKVNDEIQVCVDNLSSDGVTQQYTINESIDNEVNSLNVRDIPLKSYDDIYRLTFSGFNSPDHEVNLRRSKKKEYIGLIPIITISRGSREVSFRIDDHELRWLFFDTELLINGDDKLIINNEEKLRNSYNKQLTMLNDLFNN